MSEQFNKFPEHNESTEDQKPYGEAPKLKHESLPTPEELATRKREEIERLAQKIEREAKSGAEIRSETHQGPDTTQYDAYGSKRPSGASQTLRRAQKQLKPAERQFSRVVHNQKVEAISDAAGGTIARPSGLLVGGIFSFATSIVVLIACNYLGYEYNYAIGLASFVGGFMLGLLFETIYKILKRFK